MTVPDAQAARRDLLPILRREAVLRGDFVLSSGARSSYYIDARRVTLSSAGAALIGVVVLDLALAMGAEAVAGLTLGADPIVASVATVAGLTDKRMDALIVRKAAKAHGTGRRTEGPWTDGVAVAIVDDTFTTGTSALEAASAVLNQGGKIAGVIALIDREQGARQAVEAAGYRFERVFSADDVL